MSRAWANGSTRQWRRDRTFVLDRDGHRCRMGDPTHPIGKAQPRASGCTGSTDVQVHHTRGRRVTGDDPEYMVAACRTCNLAVGDPTKTPDPAPRPMTRW